MVKRLVGALAGLAIAGMAVTAQATTIKVSVSGIIRTSDLPQFAIDNVPIFFEYYYRVPNPKSTAGEIRIQTFLVKNAVFGGQTVNIKPYQDVFIIKNDVSGGMDVYNSRFKFSSVNFGGKFNIYSLGIFGEGSSSGGGPLTSLIPPTDFSTFQVFDGWPTLMTFRFTCDKTGGSGQCPGYRQKFTCGTGIVENMEFSQSAPIPTPLPAALPLVSTAFALLIFPRLRRRRTV